MTRFYIGLMIVVSLHAHAQPGFMRLDTAAGSAAYPNIHSILISQNGRTVYEKYFNGFHKDSLHDSRSSFKSVTSLLVGIAIDKGLIRDVDQKVHTFFPTHGTFVSDPLKRQISIRDLLEMRAGFDCDEWAGGKDCESEMEHSDDWVDFSLALPMKNKPGTVWAYTSCAPMILSGILEKATGMNVQRFADENLFSKLGIRHYRWTHDPKGHGMTAGSFYILPTDMLKIGQMVLDLGRWNGNRIVSEKWIGESTKAAIPIPDGSFVKTSRTAFATPQPAYYGYYWYNETIQTKSGKFRMVFASGNGGQYIIVIPQLKLVTVFTQGNYGSRVAKQAFDMLAQFILPAFTKNE